MTFLFLILHLISRFISSNDQWDSISDFFQDYSEAFFWRDYNGIIPKDALAAGRDRNGEVTYVGQVLHENSIIPGEIRPNEKKIFYELYQSEFTATRNIKILCCVLCKSLFEWVPVSNNFSSDIVTTDLVEGGFEEGNVVYIGRVNISATGQTAIGKVSLSSGEYAELRISPYKGRDFKYVAFEMLVFTPPELFKYENKLVSLKPAVIESCSAKDRPLTQDSTTKDTKDVEKSIVVDINILFDKLIFAVFGVCIMQYLIMAIFCSIIYILICLVNRPR